MFEGGWRDILEEGVEELVSEISSVPEKRSVYIDTSEGRINYD